jgi:hypothetical protein
MGVAAERSRHEAADLRRRFPRVYARMTGRPWRRLARTMKRLEPSAAGRTTASPKRARSVAPIPRVPSVPVRRESSAY